MRFDILLTPAQRGLLGLADSSPGVRLVVLLDRRSSTIPSDRVCVDDPANVAVERVVDLLNDFVLFLSP